MKLFGFSGLRLYPLPRTLTFSSNQAPPEFPEPLVPPRLHAFTVSREHGSKVFGFDDTPEGHRALAAHIRSEDVMTVVRGHVVPIEHLDVLGIEATRDSQNLSLALQAQERNKI